VLDDPAQLSGSETIIDFEGFSDEERITDQYAFAGVTFLLSDGTGAHVYNYDATPRQFGPAGEGCIDNLVSSEYPDLDITFASPMNRFAFEIRNYDVDDLTVTMTCLTDGQVVGSQFFETDLSFSFVALESAETFDQILIDVAPYVGAFRLDNLRFEYWDPAGSGTVTGTVLASCPTTNTPVYGVQVDAYASGTGDLVASAVTDESGGYTISDLTGGDYVMTVVTPLGYTAALDEVAVEVACGAPATADFALSCVGITADPRSIGFWKHQVGVALGGNGHAQIDDSLLCDYLDLIDVHFNSNQINQVVVYQPPESELCADKLAVAKDLLNLKGKVEMIARARQQLVALLLNVAAEKISLTQVVSEDGATCSQAITFCDNVIDDPDGDHERAKDICDLINNSLVVPAGMIPLETANIAYKLLPDDYSLSQNYPNPFNPSTDIAFTLPERALVRISVYNTLGQQVATPVNQEFEAGEHTISWHAGNLASGIYFYRLQANDFAATRKMVLLK
jgi:hypothetical protein